MPDGRAGRAAPWRQNFVTTTREDRNRHAVRRSSNRRVPLGAAGPARQPAPGLFADRAPCHSGRQIRRGMHRLPRGHPGAPHEPRSRRGVGVSRRKPKRGVGGSDPTIRYVGLTHLVLNSQAWKTLPGDAIKLLIDVWKRHNGVNNGEITYGCRGAADRARPVSDRSEFRRPDRARLSGRCLRIDVRPEKNRASLAHHGRAHREPARNQGFYALAESGHHRARSKAFPSPTSGTV